MAAPVLTLVEQNSALNKKKKKRILKNVLGLPKYLKVESLIAADSETEKLKNILKRLLPSARLPIQQNFKCKNTTQATPEEITLKHTAQLKRKQLSLGVNDLNKSIKKGLISAALLASDIEPKFLIHHLNLLCSHNKIPYLHLIGLREITKNCLGFPCIALGFKNNSDFSEAITEIKSISDRLEKSEDCEKSDTDVTDNESMTDDEIDTKNEEPPFTYLYRSSTKERVFVPEEHSNDKKTDNYISVDTGEITKPEYKVPGISAHLVNKKSEEKVKPKEDSSSDEDYQIPRKKHRKNWDIDKVGVKQKPRYHPVNLVKVSSNPNRISRKRKF